MRKLPTIPNIHFTHITLHPFPSSFPLPLFFRHTTRSPPHSGVRMDSTPIHQKYHHDGRPQKDKIVVILGATGCGKSRLSIDLATRFFNNQSEIINSDKIQIYKGLDITTNKIPVPDRKGVPHHLLGYFDPDAGEFTPSDFRFSAGLAISDIVSRQRLPIVVGGSNSFIHALVVDQYEPDIDVFQEGANQQVSTQLRYDCCFLWVDVSLPVLCDYLCRRVDEMLDSGMFEELSEFYDSVDSASQSGLRKAIGVPEFDRYFQKYRRRGSTLEWDEVVRKGAYEEAVREIKEKTCQLAERQLGKIMRLKGAGWDLKSVDATEAFREVMRVTSPYDWGQNGKKQKKQKKKKNKKRWVDVWERLVVEPSVKIVKRFLEEE